MNSKDIKFRYYDPVLNRLVYSEEWGHKDGLKNLSNFFDYASIYAKDGIIQRYINLKDKNGREVYEGDIMSYMPFGDLKYHGFKSRVPNIGIYFGVFAKALGKIHLAKY